MLRSAPSEDVDIDLGQMASAVWRRKGRVLAITIVAAGAAFAVATAVRPQYKSETRLLIEQRAPAFASLQGDGANANPLLDELNITSQVQLLQSADLIKQIIAARKLYELREFEEAAKGTALSQLLVFLHLKKDPAGTPPEERLIDAFNEKLQVYQVPGSRVIGITFSSWDPKLAAEIPNAMADAYLALQSGAKLNSNSEATRWLEPEIEKLRGKVEEAEQKVAAYRKDYGLLPTNGGSTFTSQQLNDISAELTRVRGERTNAEARANSVRSAIKSGEAFDTLPDIIGSPTIQRLKATESALQSQLSDLQTALLPNHPRIKGLRAQIADIRAQIRTETQKVLASIENEKSVADMRLKQLEQQVATVKTASAQAGEAEVGLAALEREAAAQRSLLETYLARYREATSRIDKNSAPADARVVSAAVQPVDPYFPKIGPIVLVTALAALILSAVGVMLAELFSGRALRPVVASAPAVVAREEEVEAAPAEQDHLKVEARPATARKWSLARLMGRKSKADDADVDHPAGDVPAFAERYSDDERAAGDNADDERGGNGVADLPQPSTETDEIAAQEVNAGGVADVDAEDNQFSIISVADYLIGVRAQLAIALSPSGDDGSAATVCLARALADAGKRVVLVDLTASGCPTALMMAEPNAVGITDLLAGKVPFGDTIHADQLSEVHVIPQGQGDLDLAMRGTERLSILIDALVSAYEMVVVECGTDDVAAMSRFIGNKDVEILLSMPQIDEQIIIQQMSELEAAGYERVLLMSGGDDGFGKLALSRAA